MINENNSELLAILGKYSEDITHYRKIKSAYDAFENQFQGYEFFGNNIKTGTIIRGVRLLQNFVKLQLILNKPFYFPGIGLFEIKPNNYFEHYNIKDLKEIIPSTFIKNSFTSDNKIDYYGFYNSKYPTIKNYNTQSQVVLISAFNSIITEINTLIIEHIGEKINKKPSKLNIKKTLDSQCGVGSKLIDIVNDTKTDPLNSFLNYFDDIVINNNWDTENGKDKENEGMAFNRKILEELIYIIGYIEANQL